MNKIFISILLLLMNSMLYAQKTVSIGYENKQAKDVLLDIQKQYDVKFSYPDELVANKVVNLPYLKRSLDDVLFELAVILHVDFVHIDAKYIYLNESSTKAIAEVVVASYINKGIQKENDGSFSINTKKLESLTGFTEADVLEGLQQLPGVVSANDNATELNVRGGNTDQNLVLYDGITIYHSGHLFGMVSVFNPNTIKKIQFINNGTSARYGGRASSIITMETATKIAKKNTIEAGLNFISGDVFLDLPIIKNKLGLQASFRRSYEDVVETITFKNSEHQAFQHTNIKDELFHFKDYNVKLNYLLDDTNTLNFSLIHVDNDLENDRISQTNNESYFDFIDMENDGYSINWKKQLNARSYLETNFHYSHYRMDYDSKVYDSSHIKDEYLKNNIIYDKGITSIYTLKANEHIWRFGYENSYKKVSHFIKEFSNGISYDLNYKNVAMATHSIFTANILKHNKWTLNYGLRVNYYDALNKVKFEPRFVLNKKINSNLNIQFSGEVKNQVIKQLDETILSSLASTTKVWLLSDGENHPIIQAKQLATGFSYHKNNWTFDATIYYKNTTGISSFTLGFLNPLDNTIHTGIQNNIGVDLFFQRRFKKFNTWISYSYMDLKDKYFGLNNDVFFTGNTEIKHNLAMAFSYKSNNFKTGFIWKVRSGKPSTDLDYDIAGNAYFDAINDARLPVYQRLDFSATYKFKISTNTKAKLGLAVKNVLNRSNIINTAFIGNNTVHDPIRSFTQISAGITPNVLLRFYF